MTSSVICGSRSKTAGTTRPPIPLAVSATTFSGRRAFASTNPTTWSANASSTLRCDSVPRAGVEPEGEASSRSAPALTASRPVSAPTGRAPDRQNLMPLYCAGLCEAVNIAPGALSEPAAKYNMSVLARPRSTTFTPRDIAPSANAAASSTPEGRMSRATRTVGSPANSANATPTARAMSTLNCSGTVPRTSYALKILSSCIARDFVLSLGAMAVTGYKDRASTNRQRR